MKIKNLDSLAHHLLICTTTCDTNESPSLFYDTLLMRPDQKGSLSWITCSLFGFPPDGDERQDALRATAAKHLGLTPSQAYELFELSALPGDGFVRPEVAARAVALIAHRRRMGHRITARSIRETWVITWATCGAAR